MTLNTYVYVHGPVDRDEFATFCNGLIGDRPDGCPTVSDETDTAINNAPGQSLRAWLMISANADGTPVQPEPEEHDEWCSENCSRAHDPAHFLRASFDTSYGYRGPNGETCAMLHTFFIIRLVEWTKAHDTTLTWRNEYTGSLHQGTDGLQEFIGNGDSANEWFNGLVAQAIEQRGL